MYKILFILLITKIAIFANTITVIGYGDTKDKALKSAFQNAVEQEVGVLVDSKTVVKNGKLIKNKILTFSNGFIKDYKELSANNQMGFWTVKISAVVEHQKLLSKLKKIKINPKQIKGTKQLYAQVVSQVKTKFDAEDIFKKFYNTFTSLPIENYYAEVTDFKIDTDLATRKYVPVKVSVKIKETYSPIVEQQLEQAFNLMKKLSTKMKIYKPKKDQSIFSLVFGSLLADGDCEYPKNEIKVVRYSDKAFFCFPRSYSVIYPFNNGGFGNAKRRLCAYTSVLFLDKHGKILKKLKTETREEKCLSSMVSDSRIGRSYLDSSEDETVNWNMPLKYLKKIAQVKAKLVWKPAE